MSATAKNLEAIQKALDAHNRGCSAPVTEIRMSPFEVERLGFDDFAGIPIVGDPEMQTGRVRVICSGVGGGEEAEEQVTEAVGVEVPANA